MLNEMLTQILLTLDNLDVEGHSVCRSGWESDLGEDRLRRKSLINRIHDLCTELEAQDLHS